MQPTRYFVAPGRGVQGVKGALYAAGAEVTPDGVSDIEALLRSGFVVADSPVEPEPAPPRPVDATPSRLAMDPALLEGQTLEQLNVLVLERAPDEPAFDDIDEAIAFLSQDFGTVRQPVEN